MQIYCITLKKAIQFVLASFQSLDLRAGIDSRVASGELLVDASSVMVGALFVDRDNAGQPGGQ
jgi:hypothetical protein